jgi:hypothetical protein
VIVGHQGGWDEALFVAVPMAVFATLLWVAKRRAEAEAATDVDADADADADDAAR